MIRDFLTAIAFLTRVPAGHRAAGAGEVGRSARWFPLVGALLGALYAFAGMGLSYAFPAPLAAVLVVALDAWITGGLHFDGLADTADGLGGGRTAEDALRIMRDHAVGSYGTLAIVLAVLIKALAIAALLDKSRAPIPLLLAPALGRWSAVVLSASQPYARPMEKERPSRFVGRTELLIATVTTLAGAAAAGWQGAAACLITALGAVWWGWRCRRRIGGITGDTLGAGIEISECLVLLWFAALTR